MTGGQALDLAAEGQSLSAEAIEHMYAMKTGALIHAAVLSAALLAESIPQPEMSAIDAFGRTIGIAFQIKDDILDVEGDTDVIGKQAGADDGRVHALRRDGGLRWSFVAQKDIRSAIASTPDGRIYVSSFDGNLYALEASGEVVWVFSAGGVLHSSPVVDVAGTVYVGSQDDHLYALTPEGRARWKLELPQDVDSSVAIAEDGTIVFGCDDGHLRAYR
jgi:outer membrane protein assembly factor BamB